MYVTIERRDQDNLSTALVIVLCGSSLRKLQSVMHFSATLSSATKFFTALFTALFCDSSSFGATLSAFGAIFGAASSTFGATSSAFGATPLAFGAIFGATPVAFGATSPVFGATSWVVTASFTALSWVITASFTASSWVVTASFTATVAVFTALSWVVPTLSWGVAGPFRKTTFDIRRPTAERRPTFNSRLSAVECRITVVGRRMSNAATIAITSTPICVCRYNWDTPGSSKTDCLRLSPSSPPPCASARRISDTSAHRWRQSRRRAPQGALLSDAP